MCWINLCKLLYIFPKYKKSYSAKTIILLVKVENITGKILIQIICIPNYVLLKKSNTCIAIKIWVSSQRFLRIHFKSIEDDPSSSSIYSLFEEYACVKV